MSEVRRPYSRAEIKRAGGQQESPQEQAEGVELDIEMEAMREEQTKHVWAVQASRQLRQDFRRVKMYGDAKNG